MNSTPLNETLALSQLLDMHLEASVDWLRGDDSMSSKFKELAERMQSVRKGWDQRADNIMEGMTALEKRGDAVFGKHEGALASAEQGFAEMEAAVRDLEGSNNPPSEKAGSGDTAGSFPKDQSGG